MNAQKKKVVCIVCGGQSAEHEVSIQSARNILGAMNREVYDVLLVGITKNGVWRFISDEGAFMELASVPTSEITDTLGTEAFPLQTAIGPAIQEARAGGSRHEFDVLFPVLHGTNGEDGAIQGLCRMLNCPCVGCDLAASALCMDKDFAKRLLEYAGIAVAKWRVVYRDGAQPDTKQLIQDLGLPLFVKPARTGSSVGVCKVTREEDIVPAIENAFAHDTKVLIEEAIKGREIECAVLGNGTDLFAAVPGEVVPNVDFYSYEAKYISDDGATLLAPAPLTAAQVSEVQAIAKRAFILLECAGFTRVDFFLSETRGWILNELNTIPGFTQISMYPRLMGVSGIQYPELVDKLVSLALEKPPVFF